jgi:23S rRNA (adenine2030-N6)-methyltransferase
LSNYNHSRKAGNQGDVLKHMVLVEVVRHLIDLKAATHSKDFTFGYMETHAGAPEHRLAAGGEWTKGIGQFTETATSFDHNYFHLIGEDFTVDQVYPSSWNLAKKVIRMSDVSSYNLHLFDTSADVAVAMKPVVHHDPRIKYECKDGFKHFKDNSLQRVDFVFIDPPYKTDKDASLSKDWLTVQKTAEYLLAKKIPFLIWYPFFTEKNPRKLVKALELPTLELIDPSAPDNNRVLKGSGLIFGNINEKYVWELQQYIADPLKVLGVLTKYN